MNIQVLYFAWLRERIGHSSETLETNAKTVSDLVDELKSMGEIYAFAFSDMRTIKVALDQDLADLDASLVDVREVAFFPPMTGG